MRIYCLDLNTNKFVAQVELNKVAINRYFEKYNDKNEAIFDEIIAPDNTDRVKLVIWACLEFLSRSCTASVELTSFPDHLRSDQIISGLTSLFCSCRCDITHPSTLRRKVRMRSTLILSRE
jgi:CRISPR/Cas system-associated protein Csm6